MPRTKGFDDAAVVTAARDVFWEYGYAATSMSRLQAATGLSRSSLYETYGSKRGLFQRAAQDYLDVVIEPLITPLEREGAGPTDVMNWFLAFGAHFRESPARIATRGCLMLNTATELQELDDAAAAMVRAFRERVRAGFRNSARGMRVDDPERHADLWTAEYLGLITTSRLDRTRAVALAQRLADEATARAKPTRRSRRS